MPIKLTDYVRIKETGEVTTCQKLLEEGRAIVRKVDHFHSPTAKKGWVPAYFCDLVRPYPGQNPDTEVTSGWRIRKIDYTRNLDRYGEAKLPVIEEENKPSKRNHFSLVDDASFTRLPPCREYKIIYNTLMYSHAKGFEGTGQAESLALRSRGSWHDVKGNFICYDSQVAEAFVPLVCNNFNCGYGFKTAWDCSLTALKDAEGVMACEYCGELMAEPK